MVKPQMAVISVFDNSLLYAEGLFETFLAINDRVIFMREHLQRLYKGLALTGIRIPINRATLKKWIENIAARHPSRIKKIRLTLTSGESERWTGKQGKPKIILSAATHEFQTRPFKLFVSDFIIDENSAFRRIKTISYALNAAAYKQSKRKRCDDAILINEKSNIVELTSANIFWVRKGRIYTPKIGDGCLEGVTRRRIISEAARIGIKVVEKTEKLRGLLAADEIFVSSSLKLASPVGKIIHDMKNYTFPVGPVTSRLRERFVRLLKLHTS